MKYEKTMEMDNKIITCALLTALASKVASGINIQWQSLAKGEGVGVGMGQGGGRPGLIGVCVLLCDGRDPLLLSGRPQLFGEEHVIPVVHRRRTTSLISLHST